MFESFSITQSSLQATINFTWRLIILILMSLVVHLFVLQYNTLTFFDHLLVRSYLVNFFLAIVIFIFLELSKKKHVTSLGFIYMAGSILKFIAFFVFFYHHYHEDGNIEKIEFLTFFTPYSACLIYETFYLVQMLNAEPIETKKEAQN